MSVRTVMNGAVTSDSVRAMGTVRRLAPAAGHVASLLRLQYLLMGKCVSRLRNCIDAGQKHAASLETCELLSNFTENKPAKIAKRTRS